MNTSKPARDEPGSATKLKRRGIFACAVAVALAGALYVNTLDNPFIYDDHRLIVENRSLLDPGNVRAILWRDVTRPLVNISYAVDHALWGPAPFGFHLTNVLLHMLNVGLVALLAGRAAQDLRAAARGTRSWLEPPVVAATTSLLFAVHPMLTSAVGYISGRSELLCGLFFLLAMLAARRWMATRHVRWLVPAIVSWLLALASKEIAALLPLLVLAYDRLIAPTDPVETRHRLRWLHLPFFGVAAALVVLRLFVFTSVEHGGGITLQWRYALVELDVIRRYVTMLVLPAGQSIFHAVDPAGFGDSRTITAAAAIALMLWGAWIWRRRSPIASFGILWFLLLLVPSSALVVLDRGEPMVEHRVYLASAGIFMLAGTLTARAWTWAAEARRVTRFVCLAATAAVLVSLAGRTMIRNRMWESPTLVWIEAVNRAPDHWLPHVLLGEELHRTGRHDQAILAFRRVLQLRPQEVGVHARLGVCLSETGDLDQAQASFEKLRGLDARSAEASNGLATVALLRGRTDVARQGYLETLSLDPLNIAARRGLAVLEETAGGNPAEALRWCEEIERLAPGTAGNEECLRRNRARLAGRNDAQ